MMPQTRKIVVEPRLAAPDPPTPAPSNRPRLTGHVETRAERVERVMRVIRSRTFGILSDDDLALVLRPMLNSGEQMNEEVHA